MSRQGEAGPTEPFSWRAVEERVERYLCREGVPATEAERLSHAVIAICADAGEAMDRSSVHDHALDEARTLLETWQAARHSQVLAEA